MEINVKEIRSLLAKYFPDLLQEPFSAEEATESPGLETAKTYSAEQLAEAKADAKADAYAAIYESAEAISRILRQATWGKRKQAIWYAMLCARDLEYRVYLAEKRKYE